MTTAEKCAKPATAAVKLGTKSGEHVPACDDHLYKARAKSNRAGKKEVTEMFTLPKGASAAERKKHEAAIASFVGTNQDDVLPISVRPLTQFEKDANMGCYAHLLPLGGES